MAGVIHKTRCITDATHADYSVRVVVSPQLAISKLKYLLEVIKTYKQSLGTQISGTVTKRVLDRFQMAITRSTFD